jgi:hypothetical protein
MGARLELYRNTGRYIVVTGVQIGSTPSMSATEIPDRLAKHYSIGQSQSARTFDDDAGDEKAASPAGKSGGLDFNQAPSQADDDIEDLIQNGAPEGQRHQAFQRVINTLAAQGLDCDEIEAKLRQYPNGIAAKFLDGRDRLRAEIDRSYAKWRASQGPQPAPSPAYAGNASGGGSNGPGGSATPPNLDAEPLGWHQRDRKGKPVSSVANARRALQRLSVTCRYDEFHDRFLIEGVALGAFSGQLSDYGLDYLADRIFNEFQLELEDSHLRKAIKQVCLRHRFDPICDYLDSLKWDGVKRIERWLIDYFGAEDTPLNRAISKIFLVAAVRRARKPGCKFDTILSLEAKEGTMKSSAIEVMAGKENFTDQSLLGASEQRVQELLCGVWWAELADLVGIRKAEVEQIKALASRTHDRGRPAYGREVKSQARHCVMIATTNETEYLKSVTGNRRFWPVKTGEVDIEALSGDRDQLYAEAAAAEAEGFSIVLPRSLWDAAKVEQDERVEHDPWEDELAPKEGELYPAINGNGWEERFPSHRILREWLFIEVSKVTNANYKRLAVVMQKLGWEKRVFKENNKTHKGYARPHAKP